MTAFFKGTLGNIGPVRFFLLVGAVFGLVFLFITPPFQGADEVVHFYRSYQLSEGKLVIDHSGKTAGGNLPVSLGKVVAITYTPTITFYPQIKYKEGATKYAASVKLEPSKKKLYEFSSTANYSPVSYAPSSIAMFFGRILNAGPIFLFYMARLANLALWLGLMALAIHWMPRKKWALVTIACCQWRSFRPLRSTPTVLR